MQNENVNENLEVKPNDNNQYIEALKKVKDDFVPKEEYNKLMEENKSLIDGIINGRQTSTEETVKPEPVDLGKLRNEIFNGELNNLEYVKKSLQLRKEVMSRGEPDPFLPVGQQISPTDYDIEKANQVAEVLQECVDYADGNSEIFTQELMRRTVDVKIR